MTRRRHQYGVSLLSKVGAKSVRRSLSTMEEGTKSDRQKFPHLCLRGQGQFRLVCKPSLPNKEYTLG